MLIDKKNGELIQGGIGSPFFFPVSGDVERRDSHRQGATCTVTTCTVTTCTVTTESFLAGGAGEAEARTTAGRIWHSPHRHYL
jgi:hypothetical protein